MKKAFLIVILIVFGSKIVYSQDYFTVKQKESNLPIKIGADTITNKIYRVGFPLVFEITYQACDTINFFDIEYLNNPLYNGRDSNRWLTTGGTYNYDNKESIYLKQKDKSRIFDKKNNKHTYLYYTTHIPSNDSLQQAIFAPYVQRMREQKKTVIEIESIQELKAKNADLTNTFLIGDSIRFLFRNKNGFYKQTIPVEVK